MPVAGGTLLWLLKENTSSSLRFFPFTMGEKSVPDLHFSVKQLSINIFSCRHLRALVKGLRTTPLRQLD